MEAHKKKRIKDALEANKARRGCGTRVARAQCDRKADAYTRRRLEQFLVRDRALLAVEAAWRTGEHAFV